MANDRHVIAEFESNSEAETAEVAALLAPKLQAGDVVALYGTLGAGKTAFARALINTLPGETEDVPSPTFTLVQTYERDPFQICHFDLYRLEDPEDAYELGIDDAFFDAISLIEWPENLGHLLPARHLHINLDSSKDDQARRITFAGNDEWMARLSGIAGGKAT